MPDAQQNLAAIRIFAAIRQFSTNAVYPFLCILHIV